MATYGEVKADFLSLLNRRDITTGETTAFLQNAIARIQRNLRIPAMEAGVDLEIDADYSTGVSIPTDYLQLIRIVNSQGKELDRADMSTVKSLALASGVPTVYARQGAYWVLGPAPTEGETLRIDYYAQFAAVSEAADENTLTIIAPDLIMYGALSFAGERFNDKRQPAWEQRYQTSFVELQDQGDRDELLNSVVSPASSLSFSDDDV